MKANELKEKLQKLLKDARDLCDVVDKASRDFTDEERTKVAGMLKEAGELKDQIKQVEGDNALRMQFASLGEGIGLAPERQKMTVQTGGRGKTIGEQFVESAAIKEWLARFPGGRIPETTKGLMSPPVEVQGLWQRKTLITSADDTQAGAFISPEYTGLYEPLGRPELVLRDLISLRQTGSDLVEFVRQTAQVQQATPVAEANVTTYSGGTTEVSGEKPEGTVGFERVQAPVKTIAAWIPATKRALSDAAQIRGIIDEELSADVGEELENQILNGNGAGENFTGLTSTAGVLAQLWVTDVFVTTRQAITTLRTTGRTRPTAWLMHPSDWETLDLSRATDGHFYWGGPFQQGQPRLWGYPVVQSQLQTAGTAILGDWKKAVLWDRERPTIQVSDSHEDFFIRNMVAFLCELRAAFGLLRPSAFIEVDMSSGS